MTYAKGKIKMALVLPYDQPERWKLASQMGVTHAIATVASQLTKISSDKYLDTLHECKVAPPPVPTKG